MKSQCVLGGLAFVLAIVTHNIHAQTTDYTVTSRGADYKVLQKTTVENGTNRIHQYIKGSVLGIGNCVIRWPASDN